MDANAMEECGAEARMALQFVLSRVSQREDSFKL